MKFDWIDRRRHRWPIEVMCDLLGVTRSGFYAWRKRPAAVPAQERRMHLIEQIQKSHQTSRCTYGSPGVVKNLNAWGTPFCHNTVARLMRLAGIGPKVKCRFVPRTTDSNHPNPIAANRLNRCFSADGPDRKWVCDFTFIWTEEGWLYLATVMDLFSRKIVGWSMRDHMRTDLVAEVLRMAIHRRRPEAGLLHHSDRGVQYASGRYQHLLIDHGIVCSMSRRGDCYDNAAAESFYATLKRELVNGRRFGTLSEAKAVLFEWIEVFYNRQRRHSSLNYLSPEAFEAQLN